MIEPITGVAVAATPRPRPARAALVSGYLGGLLLGWTGLLVPSLIRSIEHDFGQSDAGLGVYYFLYAVFYGLGGAAGGLLTGRRGQRTTLPLAAASLAVGLGALALAPNWHVFLAASAPFGLGAGAIDAGINGLFLDLYPGRGGPLNLLQLFFSVGALVAPLAVGLLVVAGAPWPVVVFATAVAALLVGRLFALAHLPVGPVPPGGEGERLDTRLLSLRLNRLRRPS